MGTNIRSGTCRRWRQLKILFTTASWYVKCREVYLRSPITQKSSECNVWCCMVSTGASLVNRPKDLIRSLFSEAFCYFSDKWRYFLRLWKFPSLSLVSSSRSRNGVVRQFHIWHCFSTHLADAWILAATQTDMTKCKRHPSNFYIWGSLHITRQKRRSLNQKLLSFSIISR